MKRENASLLKTILRIYGFQLLLNSLLIIIEVKLFLNLICFCVLIFNLIGFITKNQQEMTKIVQPLFISMVLVYFNGGIERKEALMYGLIISVCAIIGGVLHHPYYFNSWRIGMKIRVACSGLMYRKVTTQKLILLISTLLI